MADADSENAAPDAGSAGDASPSAKRCPFGGTGWRGAEVPATLARSASGLVVSHRTRTLAPPPVVGPNEADGAWRLPGIAHGRAVGEQSPDRVRRRQAWANHDRNRHKSDDQRPAAHTN